VIEITPCYNCIHEVDTVDHMLMGCVYARKVCSDVSDKPGYKLTYPMVLRTWKPGGSR
jgi:hypothetical protein